MPQGDMVAPGFNYEFGLQPLLGDFYVGGAFSMFLQSSQERPQDSLISSHFASATLNYTLAVRLILCLFMDKP